MSKEFDTNDGGTVRAFFKEASKAPYSVRYYSDREDNTHFVELVSSLPILSHRNPKLADEFAEYASKELMG